MKPIVNQRDTGVPSASTRTDQQPLCTTEDQCRRRGEWLELLFARAADAILVHEINGRILDANRAASELFGYTHEELLTLHPWDLLIRPSRRELLRSWQRVKRAQPVTVEQTYRHQDGRLVHAEARLTRFNSAGRDVIMLVCRDVTDRKRLEAALRASQRKTEQAEQRRQAAVLEERTRMARDIHDTMAQGFTGIIIQVEASLSALQSGDRQQAGGHLYRAGELARASLAEARRTVSALRPLALETAGLAAALRGVIRQMTRGTNLKALLTLTGRPRPLPPSQAEHLLRIGQEALTNTLKHSHASRFQARLIFARREVRLELSDNGHGFDPSDENGGLGLRGMGERTERLGGRLRIASTPGRGATILVSVPEGEPR